MEREREDRQAFKSARETKVPGKSATTYAAFFYKARTAIARQVAKRLPYSVKLSLPSPLIRNADSFKLLKRNNNTGMCQAVPGRVGSDWLLVSPRLCPLGSPENNSQ